MELEFKILNVLTVRPFRSWESGEAWEWWWFHGFSWHRVLLYGFQGLEDGMAFHGAAFWPGVGLGVLKDGDNLERMI